MRTMGLLTLLLLTAAGGWWVRGWQHSTDPSTPTSAEPTTARVMKSRIEQTVKARGIVKPAPNALVRIGFPMPKDVARRIQVMKFVEGDAIKAGDELALLDHADAEKSVRCRLDDATGFDRLFVAGLHDPGGIRLCRSWRGRIGEMLPAPRPPAPCGGEQEQGQPSHRSHQS